MSRYLLVLTISFFTISLIAISFFGVDELTARAAGAHQGDNARATGGSKHLNSRHMQIRDSRNINNRTVNQTNRNSDNRNINQNRNWNNAPIQGGAVDAVPMEVDPVNNNFYESQSPVNNQIQQNQNQ